MLEIIYAGGRISNPIQLVNSGKNKVTVVDMKLFDIEGNNLNIENVNLYVTFNSNDLALEPGETINGMVRLPMLIGAKDLILVISYMIGDENYECQKKLR